MPAPPVETSSLTLPPGGNPKDLLEPAVAAVRAGAQRLVIDLGGLERLDTAGIASLIKMLRAARETGGDVTLLTAQPGVLETLRNTGLEKLFDVNIPSEPPPSPKPPPKGRAVKRVAGAAALLLVALLSSPLRANSSAVESDPSTILARLATTNPGMRSYRANLHVDFQLRSFPYIEQHLDGAAYYRRPDSYEVVFTKVPPYAHGFDKVFADIGDPTTWTRRFTVSYAGQRSVGSHRDIVLRLVLKQRGMIDHEYVAVDPRSWHVDEMEWYYYNGGFIGMTQDFQSIDGYSLIKAQHATIRIPFVHASAEGRYDGYRTNVPIDDAVFTKDKQ